jgi:hypothetical protein
VSKLRLYRAAYPGDNIEDLAKQIAVMNLKERRIFANEKLGAPVLATVQAVSRALDKAPRTRLLGRLNLALIARGIGPKHRP